MIISYILVAIAAMLCAFMDRVENENFHTSIFRHWDQKFWYKRESWKYAKKVFNYKFDAWHIAKSLMIIALAFAIVLYKPHYGIYDVFFIGGIWNIVFNTFYNKLFSK